MAPSVSNSSSSHSTNHRTRRSWLRADAAAFVAPLLLPSSSVTLSGNLLRIIDALAGAEQRSA